jgi:hypothetical protein
MDKGTTAVLDKVGMAPANTIPDPNRPATVTDAEMLASVYRRLADARKNHKAAVSALEKGLAVWVEGFDSETLTEAVIETAKAQAEVLIDARDIIESLPLGTVAKGGANRQTVVLQFYGPVNRTLGKRLTPSEAAKINVASFGK